MRDQNLVPWASWRRPCSDKSVLLECIQQWRTRYARCHPCPQLLRQLRPSLLCGRLRCELDETTTSRTGQPRRADVAQRGERCLDGRLTAAQHRFKRIPDQVPGSEVLYFRHWAVARQIRVCKQCWRRNMNARFDQHVPGRGQSDRLQALAHAFGALRPRTNTGTSAPGAGPAPPKPLHPDPPATAGSAPPAPWPRRTTPPNPPRRERCFSTMMSAPCSTFAASWSRRAARTASHQPRPRRPGPRPHGAPAVFTQAQANAIAPVQQAEHGLQLVVAVGAAAGDVQEQVQLGRGRPPGPARVIVPGTHGAPCPHWSTSRRTLASPLLASIRRGSARRQPRPGTSQILHLPAHLLHAARPAVSVALDLLRTGSIAGHRATDPLRQLVDRYVPPGRFQQQLLGVLAVTRPAGQSFRAAGFGMGIAGQLPALPGHRRAQLDHIAASFLLPVDASAAAVLALADRDPALESPVRLCLQRGHARASACAASAETTSTTAGAGVFCVPTLVQAVTAGHGRQQQRPDQGNTHGLNFSRARSGAVFRIELGRFFEEVAGLVMLAQHPEHFANVGSDLRVLGQGQARRSCTSASSLRPRRYSTHP